MESLSKTSSSDFRSTQDDANKVKHTSTTMYDYTYKNLLSSDLHYIHSIFCIVFS